MKTFPSTPEQPLVDRLVTAVAAVLPEAYDRTVGGCGMELTTAPEDWHGEARAAVVAVLREAAIALREWPNGRSYIPGELADRVRDADADAWLDTIATQIESGRTT